MDFSLIVVGCVVFALAPELVNVVSAFFNKDE